MPHRRFEHVPASIGVLRHPCDLDLVLFFHRNPHAILTSDRIAAYVGYPLAQIARSLDVLTDGGLLERSQHPTHAARMYVLTTPPGGWMETLLEIASTRDGRRELLRAIAAAPGSSAAAGAGPEDTRMASTAIRDE